VPEGRWITLDDPPAVETTLYRVPIVSIFPPCVVAVSLGIARAALEDFESLAKGKVPTLSRRPLSERGSAQIDFARAEALIGAARSYVYEATEALWDEVDCGDEASVETRRRARLASTYAAAACAEAVDLLYTAAGSSAIFLDNPLQRYWRDVHTATQHMQIAATGFENMGRLRLTGEVQGPF
jgi:alkylation response protein AidB-like acyl-CoA dehydrogenase